MFPLEINSAEFAQPLIFKVLTYDFLNEDFATIKIKPSLLNSSGNFSKHQVPTLQLDNGDVLTESIVIAKYLCKLNPDCEIYSGD